MQELRLQVDTINIATDLASAAEKIGEAISLLRRCRSTLVTAIHDTPSDLNQPERQSVINRLISDITTCLNDQTLPKLQQDPKNIPQRKILRPMSRPINQTTQRKDHQE